MLKSAGLIGERYDAWDICITQVTFPAVLAYGHCQQSNFAGDNNTSQKNNFVPQYLGGENTLPILVFKESDSRQFN